MNEKIHGKLCQLDTARRRYFASDFRALEEDAWEGRQGIVQVGSPQMCR